MNPMTRSYRVKVDQQKTKKSWRARLANDRTYTAESKHSPAHAAQVLGLRAFYPDLPAAQRNQLVDRIRIEVVEPDREFLVGKLGTGNANF